MDKFFHSTFDFFLYFFPGACIVSAFLLLDRNFDTLRGFLNITEGDKLVSAIILLLLGYIIGFAIYPIGRKIYKSWGFKLWPKKIHNDVDLSISDKYILIRELSPNNFKYVETWNIFCSMAHNLAVACMVVFVIVIIKVIFIYPGNLLFWIFFCAGMILLFFLFLHRAVVFSIWAADDLNAAIRKLNLLERAEKLPEKN